MSHPITLSLRWLAAGASVAALLVLGVALVVNDPGLAELRSQLDQTQLQQREPPPLTVPASQPANSVALAETPPGVLPSFAGLALTDSLAFLEQLGLNFLIIEADDQTTAAGVVLQQAPSPGATVSEGDVISLTVSAGSASDGASPTDCLKLESSAARTPAEQRWFEDNCGLPDRTHCEEIRGTSYRSASERDFFLSNCITS